MSCTKSSAIWCDNWRKSPRCSPSGRTTSGGASNSALRFFSLAWRVRVAGVTTATLLPFSGKSIAHRFEP